MREEEHDEEELLRSVALQNVRSIVAARQRAEEELVRAREELRASRERLAAALSAADTGTFRWDVQSGAFDADENLARLFGVSAEDSPRSFDEFISLVHERDRASLNTACRDSVRDQTELDTEFGVVWRDGSLHWIAARGKSLSDGRGTHVTGACTEITRRKVSDERLRQGTERLQLALSAGQLGDWSWDVPTDVVTLGERAAAVFGLPANQPITWTRLRDLLHEEHREIARLALETALATHTDYGIEYRVRRPSGEDCWIAAHGRGIYAPDGAVLGMIGVVQDITPRKAVEQALRQNADRVRVSFEQAAVGIATARLDGRFSDANQKFASILGYEREELWALSFRDITHPDDAAETNSMIGRLLAGELTDYSLEKRYRRKDGSVIWSLTTVTAIRDAAGKPLSFIGVIEDISRRRQAEDALRKSEQFNRSIIESSRDCIKMLSLEGSLLWMSPSGCEALSIDDVKSVVGRSWVSFWPAEDEAAARSAVSAAARGGTGNFVGRLEVLGRPRWFDVVLTPILGASGAPETLLAVSREITERVDIEHALREETRMLELLNETGAVLASQLDIRALLEAVTDAATELSGAQFGAFFYNTTDENGDAYQLFTLSGVPREAFERFGHPRATPLFAPTFHGESSIRCDDVHADPRFGQWPPHHGTPPGHLPVRSYLAVPVIARSGEVIGGLFFGHAAVGVFSERSERIITGIAAQAAIAVDNARLYETAQKAAEERKQLFERERFARAEAERLSAMKDEFLAVLSHELRTPLNAILGWSQMARHQTVDGTLAKSLEVIERNARVQTQLIEDLLDMSRITSGKMRLNVQSIAPFSFIEAAVETVRPAATAKAIRLSVLLDPVAGPVTGDANRLQQVVWNLLSNAIKFTPKGGRVQVLLERVNSHIEISVADTGTGIPAGFIEHAFERFRQADASTTRKHGGLGLGLAIVKHLVELHGGTVHARSAGEGQGTTFTIKLPLAAVQRYEDGGERVHPAAGPLAGTRFQPMDLRDIKVLIVDDEADARDLVAHVLGDCGAAVVHAASAEEALALVESERPDVLLSDIGMPDVDGYELLRRVRALGEARGGRLPAVALTAFARSEDRTRALSAGFLIHVSKPIDPSELVATVASVVGRAGLS